MVLIFLHQRLFDIQFFFTFILCFGGFIADLVKLNQGFLRHILLGPRDFDDPANVPGSDVTLVGFPDASRVL